MKALFVSDLHGSEACFKKLLRAPDAYGLDTLLIGGDLTGKAFLPIIKAGSQEWRVVDEKGVQMKVGGETLSEFERRKGSQGAYTFRVSESEYTAYSQDAGKWKLKMKSLVVDRLRRWVHELEELSSRRKIRVYVLPGNDDPYFIDEVLNGSDVITNVDGKVVLVGEGIEMLGLGCSNQTPWQTPREKTEGEIDLSLDALSSRVKKPASCIANIHVPPANSGLDVAPRLKSDLSLSASVGGVEMAEVGSTAVATFIQEFQPMLGLFGHVHESRAVKKIGRTLCVNPGSSYFEGKLNGFLVSLEKEAVRGWQLIEG